MSGEFGVSVGFGVFEVSVGCEETGVCVGSVHSRLVGL